MLRPHDRQRNPRAEHDADPAVYSSAYKAENIMASRKDTDSNNISEVFNYIGMILR